MQRDNHRGESWDDLCLNDMICAQTQAWANKQESTDLPEWMREMCCRGTDLEVKMVTRERCRALVRRGTRLWTFRLFTWTLVGLIRTDIVSIGRSYLILSARRYSSQTCSRDTPHQRTTIISRRAVLSRYTFLFLPRSQFSLPLRTLQPSHPQ